MPGLGSILNNFAHGGDPLSKAGCNTGNESLPHSVSKQYMFSEILEALKTSCMHATVWVSGQWPLNLGSFDGCQLQGHPQQIPEIRPQSDVHWSQWSGINDIYGRHILPAVYICVLRKQNTPVAAPLYTVIKLRAGSVFINCRSQGTVLIWIKTCAHRSREGTRISLKCHEHFLHFPRYPHSKASRNLDNCMSASAEFENYTRHSMQPDLLTVNVRS